MQLFQSVEYNYWESTNEDRRWFNLRHLHVFYSTKQLHGKAINFAKFFEREWHSKCPMNEQLPSWVKLLVHGLSSSIQRPLRTPLRLIWFYSYETHLKSTLIVLLMDRLIDWLTDLGRLLKKRLYVQKLKRKPKRREKLRMQREKQLRKWNRKRPSLKWGRER